MASKDLGVLRPEAMDEASQFVIDTFLKNTDKKLLKKDRIYSVNIHDDANKIDVEYQFAFKRSLINRERKETKTGSRWEVLADTTLDEGGNGTILSSIGNFGERSSHMLFKPQPRILKALNESDDCKNSTIEYGYSHLAKHLHAKPPTKVLKESKNNVTEDSYISFLTMKYFPGRNLHKIIEGESSDLPEFSTDERIQLSIDILLALKKQVHDIGLIHRDLKPENIMITDKGKVKIIDYRDCVKVGENDNIPDPRGTIVTMPPEQFYLSSSRLQKYTLKSDSYAIGKTLAEFWHAEAAVNLLPHHSKSRLKYINNYFHYACADTKFDYSSFYRGDLSPKHAAAMKSIFEQLTRTKPENRWSVDQAIHCLRDIQQERLEHTHSKLMCSSKPS